MNNVRRSGAWLSGSGRDFCHKIAHGYARTCLFLEFFGGSDVLAVFNQPVEFAKRVLAKKGRNALVF